MIYKNFKYLCSLAGKTQKAVLRELQISTGSAWQWKNRGTANINTVKRIAAYFSNYLNIPYELFEDGQALLDKDFEKLLKNHESARTLQIKDTQAQYNTNSAQKLSNDEQKLLTTIRYYDSGNRNIQTSQTTLTALQEFFETSELDLNYIRALIAATKAVRGVTRNVEKTKGRREGGQDD